MSDLAIKIENVSKEYRLGAIGGTTLREEMHRFADKVFHRTPVNADYGKKFMALQDINLEVKKGERLGIIGHNGAGKSTLLKLLARVTAPTTGTISYNGRISSMLEVGTGFHGELTGRENIYMNGAILGMRKWEIDKKLDSIVEFAEMEKFIDTPVKRYSSGMYVKLAFAVAAHLDNEILIMDEVLAVGDSRFQQKCLSKMRGVAEDEGRTILYVSHNMATIRKVCDRCIVMSHGGIIYDGNVESAINKYSGESIDIKDDYFYQKEYHKYLHIHDSFLMERLKIYRKSKTQAVNDCLKMSLECKSLSCSGQVFFRFEIQRMDGIPVGTMMSNTGIKVKPGENCIVPMTVDFSGIMPGIYVSNVIAFTKASNGGQIFVDGVYPGFVFEVTETQIECNEILWRSQDWGNVRLSNITLNACEVN